MEKTQLYFQDCLLFYDFRQAVYAYSFTIHRRTLHSQYVICMYMVFFKIGLQSIDMYPESIRSRGIYLWVFCTRVWYIFGLALLCVGLLCNSTITHRISGNKLFQLNTVATVDLLKMYQVIPMIQQTKIAFTKILLSLQSIASVCKAFCILFSFRLSFIWLKSVFILSL